MTGRIIILVLVAALAYAFFTCWRAEGAESPCITPEQMVAEIDPAELSVVEYMGHDLAQQFLEVFNSTPPRTEIEADVIVVLGSPNPLNVNNVIALFAPTGCLSHMVRTRQFQHYRSRIPPAETEGADEWM